MIYMFKKLRDRYNRLSELKYDANQAAINAMMLHLSVNRDTGAFWRAKHALLIREYNELRFFFQHELYPIGQLDDPIDV